MSVSDIAAANREKLKALLEQKRHGQGRGPASYADRSRELAPLSSAQRSLWLTAQTQAGKRTYNVQLALALEGSVDVDAVRTSFERVVERHEVLRSRFDIGSEGVLQAQRTGHGLHFATRAIAATEEAEALVRSECLHEFDLAADPLLRVHLLHLAPERHYLVINTHHIVADAESLGLLVAEFAGFYGEAVAGRAYQPPALPVQYADYACWEQEWRASAEARRQLDYWTATLAGLPERLRLPTDHARPARPSGLGGTLSSRVADPQRTALERLARDRGTTLYNVLLSAFGLLLARLTGATDVAVGTAISVRTRPELRPVIGCFVNSVVLRNAIDLRTSFAELVAQTARVSTAAISHGEVAFENVVEATRVRRDPGHAPLVQVMFGLQQMGDLAPELPGLRASLFGVESEVAKYDLTLNAYLVDGGLVCRWEYSRDLFHEPRIRRIAQRYEALLEAIVATPEVPLAQIAISPPLEPDELAPWSSDGPLDRQPSPAPYAEDAEDAFVAPRSPIEHALCAVLAEVLELELERVSVGANYFELGGDSITGLKVVVRARAAGLDLNLETLMRSETIAELAATLAPAADPVASSPAPLDELLPADLRERLPASVTDAYPMSQLQLGLMFHVELDRAQSVYHEFIAHTLQLPYDDEAFRQVLRDITARHEILRTSFELVRYGTALQLVHAEVTLAIEVTDCRSGEVDVAAAVQSWMTREKAAGFDVTRPGLCRFGVFVLGDARFACIISFHHSILDGWSDASLFVEISDRYQKRLRGEPRDLAPPAMRYRDYIALELAALEDAAADRFWRERLDGCAPATIAAGEVAGHAGIEQVVLARYCEATDRLHDLARELKVSLKAVFLAVHLRVLAQCTGRADVVAGVVTNGRPETADSAQCLGLFLNTVPVAARVAGSFAELIKAVQLAEAEYWPFRRYPLPAIQRACGGRDLFDTLFNFAHFHVYGALDDTAVMQRGVTGAPGATAVFEQTNYPLVVQAGLIPGARTTYFSVVLDRGRLDEAQRARIVAAYDAALDELLGALHAPLPGFTGEAEAARSQPTAPPPRRRAPQPVDAAPAAGAEAVLPQLIAKVLRIAAPGLDESFFDLGGDSIQAIRLRSAAHEAGFDLTLQAVFETDTLAELAQVMVPITAHDAAGYQPFALTSERERAALAGRPVTDAYPLTRLQSGMLFHSLREADRGTYHDAFSYDIALPLDRALLARCLAELIARHPTLRTGFELDAAERPLQVVHAEARCELEPLDGAGLAAPGSEAHQAWLHALALGAWDLTRPPLLRARAGALDAARFRLVLHFHHAILDGWSYASLVTELLDRYAAALAGRAPRAIGDATPYAAFVAQERELLASPAAVGHWKARLEAWRSAGVRHTLGAAATASGTTSTTQTLVIDAEIVDGIVRLARDAGVPVKTVMLAAHLHMLQVLCQGERVVTGLIANGRSETDGGDRATGLFLNTIAVATPERCRSWRELCRAVFDTERADLPYRAFPLSELQAMNHGAPLFAAVFNFVNFHVVDDIARLIEVRSAGFVEETNFPLVLSCHLRPADRVGSIRLSHRLRGIDEVPLGPLYLSVLRRMVTEPDAVRTSDALIDDAQARRLDAWSAAAPTPASAPAPVRAPVDGLLERFRAQVQRAPQACAVATRGERLSYRELDARSDRLAAQLRARGVDLDAVVAICTARSPGFVVAMLAILKAGGAFLPLDALHPFQRLARSATRAGARLVLTDEPERWQAAGFATLDPGHAPPLPAGAPLPPRAPHPQRLAYVIFTSGSTGEPKGVAVTDLGLATFVAGMIERWRVAPDSRVLQFASFSFDAAVLEITSALAAGAELHLATPEELTIGPAFERLIAARGVTHALLPPAVLPHLSPAALPSLQQLIVGGDAMPAHLVGTWRAGRTLINAYGPTECAIVASVSDDLDGSDAPIGRPFARSRLHVLDRDLRRVPPGVAGELFVGGPGLARGYLGLPALTADRFVPDPFAPGERLYRTGDLVRWRGDGQLDFLGRVDDQVKLRGFRIELGEIRARLQLHRAIKDAAVVLVGDQDADRRLIAYLVAQEDAVAPDPRELRGFLRASLPEYMVPAAFVTVPELPLTASGKIDRARLPAPPARSATARRALHAHEVPVHRAYADALGSDAFGPDDDFFELGGHSLTAVRLSATLSSTLRAAVPVAMIYAHPTVAALAAAVHAGGAAAAQVLSLGRPGGTKLMVLLPTIFGTGVGYREVARRMPEPYEVISCDLAGAERVSLPELARVCVEAIRAHARARPVVLVGWSFGGVLGFEVARQMAEHGAPAHRVILIDAFLPDGARARAEFDQLEDDGMGYRRNIDALLSYRPPQPIDEVFEIRSATSAERLLADDAPFSELPARRRRVVIAPGDHRSITATENFDAIAPLLGASIETLS